MCFVWIWEQTAIISLYSINWLVFITETEGVYYAVRVQSWIVILIKAHRGDPVSMRGHFMWDLCWTVWHSERISSQYFGVPLSVSFHQCSTLTIIYCCSYPKDNRAKRGNLQKQCCFVNRKALDRTNILLSSFCYWLLFLHSIPLFVSLISTLL